MIRDICYMIIAVSMVVIALNSWYEKENNVLDYQLRLISGRERANSEKVCDLHKGEWVKLDNYEECYEVCEYRYNNDEEELKSCVDTCYECKDPDDEEYDD
mgnify:CR=1 FL=1